MKQAIILANGVPPRKSFLQAYLRLGDILICADGGANTAARFNITPDLIIGDMDSVSTVTLQRFRSVTRKKITSQNSTDLEKALAAAVRLRCTDAIVLGATGGRLDHAMGNLSALAKYSPRLHIQFIDELGEYMYIGRKLEIDIPNGTTISLLPLSVCTGITTQGLQWNLHDEALQLGVRESTSNRAIAQKVHIQVHKGDLILFILRIPMEASTKKSRK